MRAFFDTSALVKNYVRESGSEAVHAQIEQADEVLLSVLAVPEALSTFNRLRRERKLDGDRYAQLKRTLAADVADASVVALSPAVLAKAVECLEQAPLRASDAIHVASAVEAMADRFVSADRRQCAAARAMGLVVEEIPTEDDADGGADGTAR